MSDTSQGPGWWVASDGKLYAPSCTPWPGPREVSHSLCESDAPEWSEEDIADEATEAYARAGDQEAG